MTVTITIAIFYYKHCSIEKKNTYPWSHLDTGHWAHAHHRKTMSPSWARGRMTNKKVFSVILSWRHPGVIFGSSWGHPVVILGSSLGHPWVILGSSWIPKCHPGQASARSPTVYFFAIFARSFHFFKSSTQFIVRGFYVMKYEIRLSWKKIRNVKFGQSRV